MDIVKITGLIFLILFSGTCAADGPGDRARQEISHLVAYLKASGCQFNRNGSWYGPEEAADHLNDKLQYLLGKGRISSAEDFIAEAASRSSLTGQAYLVKCGSASVESAAWLGAELEAYRKSVLAASGRR